MTSETAVRPATLRALVTVAEAVFSKSGEAPAPDRLRWVETEARDFLSRAGTRSRLVLGLMVWLTCALARLFTRRFAPLASLPIPDRVRALSALEERIPEPLLAVKALLCLVYYEHPDAARDVGFDGLCALPHEPRASDQPRGSA